MRRGIFTLVVWVTFKAAEGDPGYTMDVYQESPGVYFENLGHVTVTHHIDNNSICSFEHHR